MNLNLVFETHCIIPPWASSNPKYAESARYRVYVDNDLITERNWIWDNNVFLKESIWVEINDDAEHTIKIEPILQNPKQAEFAVSRFTVVDRPFTAKQPNHTEISFRIQ